MRLVSVFVSLAALVVVQGYEIPDPTFSMMEPQGLRMSIPNEAGVTMWAVHYSVNNPLEGVTSGEWNFDVNSPTGDKWVHENDQVAVVPGDVVHYWHYALYNGAGYQKTDQSWTVTAPEPTEKPSENPSEKPAPSSTTTTTTTTTVTVSTSGDAGIVTPTTCQGKPTDSQTADKDKWNNPGYTKKPKPGSWEVECTEYPCLIFEDTFDTFDFDLWEHEITAGGGGNWEFQYYTNNRTNSYTKDGLLYIKPTLTSEKYGEEFLSSGNLELWGASPPNECTGNQWYGCQRAGNAANYINPIQSARVRSIKSFSMRYGRVEVKAQMPRGDWIWPAVWMLPKHEAYGAWPASGEIDLVESRGNADLKNEQGTFMGHQHAGSTMHWGPFWPFNQYEKTAGVTNGDFGDNFHLYIMEWDENSIRLLIDDEVMVDVDPGSGFWEFGEFGDSLPPNANPWQYGDKMAPFDKEFFFVLNVAVGGTNGFFPDTWTNGGYPKPWPNTSPTAMRDFWEGKDNWYPTWNPDANNGEDAAMKIDYVRAWKTKPE